MTCVNPQLVGAILSSVELLSRRWTRCSQGSVHAHPSTQGPTLRPSPEDSSCRSHESLNTYTYTHTENVNFVFGKEGK